MGDEGPPRAVRHMAGALDEALTRKIGELEATDPDKARALKEDALFYVRQKRQDLLTQLVGRGPGLPGAGPDPQEQPRADQGRRAGDHHDRVGAAHGGHRRAGARQSAAGAGSGHRAQHDAPATSSSRRRRCCAQQTLEIAQQAARSTVSIEKLQAAFNNIYATIDTIDTFKLAALDNMRRTIDSLSAEIARAQEYVERARSAELAQARANGLVSELTLACQRRPGSLNACGCCSSRC